jgi:hypothetical protein
VLIALSLLQESYPRELARLLGSPLSLVQKAILSLERDGMVAVRNVGRTRLATLNPRFFASRELQVFLGKLGEPEDGLRKRIALLRKRPRRTGKSLWS